ncbi:MAG: DegT/DnrJ/EryC1/StrS family aminotransferase [Spirochaetes bacterium]|nr:DegT/DnrJ/EryC1/StrS family aminotransferase [Spirochaetota bacterium]
MKSAFSNELATRKALADFILQSPRLSMDMKCMEFEQAFAKRQKMADAVLFNSGGSANLAMLQALLNLGRLKRGDKVGFSAVTWSTNVMPILQLGLSPVPLDCDPLTLNTMSSHVSAAIRSHGLKAVFITNVLGFAGDLDQIRKTCREGGAVLLEDNCEALGTELPAGATGTFGLASSHSFFVAHHMSTIEGGMVLTSDEELAEMLRIVRANGWDRNLSSDRQLKWRRRFKIPDEFQGKYAFYDLGYNLRPTEITGFLGLLQLPALDAMIRAREANYLRLEKIVAANPDLFTLKHDHITLLSNFAFPVLCKTPELREKYILQLSGAGVEIRPMIAGNLARQPFFKKYVSESFELPGADLVHFNGVYFGNYPELTANDLEILSSALSHY